MGPAAALPAGRARQLVGQSLSVVLAKRRVKFVFRLDLLGSALLMLTASRWRSCWVARPIGSSLGELADGQFGQSAARSVMRWPQLPTARAKLGERERRRLKLNASLGAEKDHHRRRRDDPRA